MTDPKNPHTRAQRADTAKVKTSPKGDMNNPEPSPTRGPPRDGTKIALVLDLLRQPGGVTIADIGSATGWQPHTVRGALAGSIQRRMGLKITSHKEPGEARRYRLDE